MFLLEFSHPVSCRCFMVGQLGGTTLRRQRPVRTDPVWTGATRVTYPARTHRSTRHGMKRATTNPVTADYLRWGKGVCRMLAFGRTLRILRITCRDRFSNLSIYMHDFICDFTGLHVRVFHMIYLCIFYVVRRWAKPTSLGLTKVPTRVILIFIPLMSNIYHFAWLVYDNIP